MALPFVESDDAVVKDTGGRSNLVDLKLSEI